MSAISPKATTEIIFQSEEALKEAIAPFSKTQFMDFIEEQEGVELKFSPDLAKRKIVPLKNPTSEGIADTYLTETDFITAYYPKNPRVPYQLSLVMKSGVKGIQDLTTDEYRDLYSLIKRVNEIYVNELGLNGFVIASYSTPQPRHEGKCVVELHPHQPGFKDYRNFLDKVDSNRHVIFEHENLSTLENSTTDYQRGLQSELMFLKLMDNHPPLTKEQNEIVLPKTMMDSHGPISNDFNLSALFELLEKRGAQIVNKPNTFFQVDNLTPMDVKTWEMKACAFCKDTVIERQKVLEYNSIYVLYNFRRTPEPGTQFLILPKRHFEKVYDLSEQETQDILTVKKALVEVLKEKHPDHEVILYTQDALSVGQTVPHTHDQVVALNPKTAALTWILMSLNYLKNQPVVSDEEMTAVTEEYGLLLSNKITDLSERQEKVIA